MYELTEQQVTIVMADVESVGINYSHLSSDLIDHICCDIEARMNQGISFNDAYTLVKKEFGIKGLRQIQQDTLMLIDKNYRIMKKSMKTIGVLAMSLMAFGALFKIFHWPGASILLSISFFFTTLVFFPTLLYVMYKEVNEKKNAILYLATFFGGTAFMVGVLFKIMHWPASSTLIFAGMSLIAYLVLPLLLINGLRNKSLQKKIYWFGFLPLIMYVSGILFKLLHWPGASILLTIGSLFLVFVFIPMYYWIEVRKSVKPRVDFVFAIIALTYFIVLSFLLQMNISRAKQVDSNLQNKSFYGISTYLLDENNSLINTINNKEIVDLLEVSTQLCNDIENVKLLIIQMNNETDHSSAILLSKTKHPLANPYGGIQYLLPESNEYSPLINLKKEIDQYMNKYEALAIQKLNLTSIFDVNNKQWAAENFGHQYASAALTRLSYWQYQIQLAQYQLIVTLNQTNKL